jgi:surface carbohydrate biosynthesis protein
MTTLYLPVEISTRELPWKKKFAIKCAQAGYRTIVGFKPLIQELACCDKNGIYFDKGYHAGKSDLLYSRLKEKNFTIISLDEEGAVDWTSGQSLNIRYPEELKDKVDYVLMWGQEQKNRFYRDAQNVIVSGHPRFNIQSLNETKAINPERILVITNASFGNNREGSDSIKQRYGSRIHGIDELIELDQIKVNKTNEVLKYFSAEYQVTLRIHPEEIIESYNFQTNGINLSHGSLYDDIKTHDLIIHFDSTVAIDVLGSQIPVISIMDSVTSKNDFTCPLPILASDYRPETLEQLYELVQMGRLHKNISDITVIERNFKPTDVNKFFEEIEPLFPYIKLSPVLNKKQRLTILKYQIKVTFNQIDDINSKKYFEFFNNIINPFSKLSNLYKIYE